jgi:AraC-like DNA-binding protein
MRREDREGSPDRSSEARYRNLCSELYYCVRHGELDMMLALLSDGEFERYTDGQATDLQVAKQMCAFNLAHCYAESIAAGVSPADADTVNRELFDKIERFTTREEAVASIVPAMKYYATVVHAYALANTPPHVKKAKDYISDHAYEPITVSEVAEFCDMSVSGLEHAYKMETGISVSAEIARTKVRRASYLLTKTDMSCAEIAHTLAFCSQSYFSERFKALTGMTPLQFRKNPGESRWV